MSAALAETKASNTTPASEAQSDPATGNKRKHITKPEAAEPDDQNDEDNAIDSLDPWSSQYREKWQKHSEMGSNLNPKGSATIPKPWMPSINPPSFDWSKRWPDIDVEALRAELLRRKDLELDYEREDLTKQELSDD